MAGAIRDPVLRFLVYSHVWLAIGAAAQVLWMQSLLDEHNWQAPVLAFLGTIVFYAFMRFARMNHPQLAPASPLIWFRERRRVMFIIAAVCSITAFIIGYPFIGDLVRTLWPAGLVALLYVVPLGFAGGRTIGLRRLPGLKAFLIAFVWAMITTGLPVGIAGGELFTGGGVFLLILQFSYVLALDIAFDIRDMPHDMKSLYTLPQLLGVRAARSFAVLFLLPWPVHLYLLFWANDGWLDPLAGTNAQLLLPIIGFFVTMLLVTRATPERNEAYYTVVLDGTFILIPLLGWIGSLL